MSGPIGARTRIVGYVANPFRQLGMSTDDVSNCGQKRRHIVRECSIRTWSRINGRQGRVLHVCGLGLLLGDRLRSLRLGLLDFCSVDFRSAVLANLLRRINLYVVCKELSPSSRSAAARVVVNDMNGELLRRLFAYEGGDGRRSEGHRALFTLLLTCAGLSSRRLPHGLSLGPISILLPKAARVAVDDLDERMRAIRGVPRVEEPGEGEPVEPLPAWFDELEGVLPDSECVSATCGRVKRRRGGAAARDAQVPDAELDGGAGLVRGVVEVAQLLVRADGDLVVVCVDVGHADPVDGDIVQRMQSRCKISPGGNLGERSAPRVPVLCQFEVHGHGLL